MRWHAAVACTCGKNGFTVCGSVHDYILGYTVEPHLSEPCERPMNSLLIEGLGQVYECLLISYIISPQNWVDETSLENAELVNRSWIIKVLWLLVASWTTAAPGDYENHTPEICNIYWHRKD